MRRTFLLILGICTLPQFAESQLFLNAGDSYATAFTFSSGTTVLGISPRCIESQAAVSSWSSGTSVRLELFENSVNEPAIGSQISTNGVISYLSCFFGNGWADHQGAVRVSVLSGSFRLDRLYMDLSEPIGMSRYISYSSSVAPVPEPSTLALISCAAVFLSCRWLV